MRISVFITIVIYTFFDHKLLYSSTYKEYLMSYMSLHHALYITLGLLYNLRLPSCARTAGGIKSSLTCPYSSVVVLFYF